MTQFSISVRKVKSLLNLKFYFFANVIYYVCTLYVIFRTMNPISMSNFYFHYTQIE